jgi:ribonuclease Z
LFDCGPATTWKLARAVINTTEIDDVFFTHHHFDHDADSPTFILTRWDQMIPRDKTLNVYGLKLTEEFTNVIIDEDTGLFAHDWKARIHHPASQIMFQDRGVELPRKKPDVDPHSMGPGLIKSGSNWEVTAAPADHVQPYLDSLAYRIDTPDGSVVLTGDTAPCDTVTDLARGADVLMMMCWETPDRMDGNPHAYASSSVLGSA